MYKLEVFVGNRFWDVVRKSNDLYLLLNHYAYLKKSFPDKHFRIVQVIEFC